MEATEEVEEPELVQRFQFSDTKITTTEMVPTITCMRLEMVSMLKSKEMPEVMELKPKVLILPIMIGSFFFDCFSFLH